MILLILRDNKDSCVWRTSLVPSFLECLETPRKWIIIQSNSWKNYLDYCLYGLWYLGIICFSISFSSKIFDIHLSLWSCRSTQMIIPHGFYDFRLILHLQVRETHPKVISPVFINSAKKWGVGTWIITRCLLKKIS